MSLSSNTEISGRICFIQSQMNGTSNFIMLKSFKTCGWYLPTAVQKKPEPRKSYENMKLEIIYCFLPSFKGIGPAVIVGWAQLILKTMLPRGHLHI